MSEPILLALDFGGTKLSAAIANIGDRKWSALKRVLTPPGKDARVDMETMLEMAGQLLEGKTPAGIGVSFGGPVDARGGM